MIIKRITGCARKHTLPLLSKCVRILEDCVKIVQSIWLEDSGLKKFMLEDINDTRGYKGLQH